MTDAKAHPGFDEVEQEAHRLGFSLVGVADPSASGHMDHYRDWLRADRHGEMGYLAREDSVARRSDLRGTMEDVRSVIVVAHEYLTRGPREATQDQDRAIIARYARGDDYHEVVKDKLLKLLGWLDASGPGGVRGRPYVDTGPILERELGQRAGLGWFGRNTMLINPARGSYFFLGVLLVDVAIPTTEPFAEDRCGSCRACLDACPTGALLGRDERGAPRIDARRCISYLTIELRGPIPPELREGIGNRIFGCDICQEVCPWNDRFARASPEPAYRPRPGMADGSLIELAETLLGLDDDGFRVQFRKSPLKRAKRTGLLRNVCVALGNSGATDALAPLERALETPDALVRGHAAWALGRLGGDRARRALETRGAVEEDDWVGREIANALDLATT